MSAGLRAFFRVGSWVVMAVTVIASLLMGLAIFAMAGDWPTRIASIVPAVSMMLTLGFSAGAGLRVLLSIDERLSSPERGF